MVPHDQSHEENELSTDSALRPLRRSPGGESEELRAIALGYDARAARDRRESHEQESGRGSSTTDAMLYSFKVSASHVPLLN